MPSPREQAAGLVEASRLLHEGLQLLEERRREVDQVLEDARERALLIKEEAELRARQLREEAQEQASQITADAERQRAELEEQVAALRSDVAELREELAQLRSDTPGGGQSAASAALSGQAADATNTAPTLAPEPPPAETTAPTAAPVAQLEESDVERSNTSGDEDDAAPRWGRRSNAFGGQAIRGAKAGRRRWLPPWLPFALILLVAAGAVATSVDGHSTGRAGVSVSPSDVQGAGTAPADLQVAGVAQAQLAAPTATPSKPLGPTGLTEDVLARATTGATLASFSVAQVTPRLTSTQSTPTTPTTQTLTLPPAGARLGTPVALPDDSAPSGPIVAAYTTYATYTVQPGDTLNQVASQFGVSGDTIVRTSGLDNPNLLLPGQVLTIPRDTGWLYRVQPGDSLDQIALRFGVSSGVLEQANGLTAAAVRLGDLVFVPDRATPAPKR